MELRGGNGSLSEGGIQVNDGNDPQGMQAYSTLGTSKLNNESAHYDCGTDMGVMVGATYNGQYAYVEVGVLPQGTTPETNFYDGNEFTLQNASWFFYNSPGDLNVSPGTDAAGIKTPCTLCSINRVTSIGENNLPNGQFFRYDGSYFGVDFVSGSLNADKIHWMQNAFGDWESDCVPPPTGTLCTFDYPLNPLETYGGAYAYPNDQVAHSSMSPVGMGPYETYDSVNLTCNGCTYNFKAKTFSEPYPPNAPSAPIPGPLKVYPETIYYPEKGNHLANCGTNQPKDPNQAGTVDPDAPFDETISFDSNGCELLNGSPDNQVSNHSVHIHEDNYYGDFVVSSVSPRCGASLSVPVIERNPGPDAWVQMNGTPNVTSSVSCTVHIMGYKGYNINVTVNMGY